jgi:hypothetical protein
VTWVFVVIVILVLGAGALLAVGLLGGLPAVEPDRRPETRDGAPSFDLAVRGYRMDEVDATIEAMQDEVTALQREVDRLREGTAGAGQ